MGGGRPPRGGERRCCCCCGGEGPPQERRSTAQPTATSKTKPTTWRSGYARAALGLIIAIGVMPAILFWQAARYFETSLFVAWGQRMLASNVAARALPASPEKWGDYGEAFYGTSIKKRPIPPGVQARAGMQARAPIGDCLLADLTIPFNQRASEIRTLVGECQDAPSQDPPSHAAPQTPQEASLVGQSALPLYRERPANRRFTFSQPDLEITTEEFPSFRWPHGGSDWLAALHCSAGRDGPAPIGIVHSR